MTRERRRYRIEQDIKTCVECPLSQQPGITPVPLYGPLNAKGMVIGEAPGKTENDLGIPFVGTTGQYLRECMERVKLDPDELVWTNVINCRPPGNRDPKQEEMDACAIHLQQSLGVTDPKVVLLVGRIALNRIRPNTKITALRGKPMVGSERTWLATWHPSYIKRNPSKERDLLDDLAIFKTLLEKEDEKTLT